MEIKFATGRKMECEYMDCSEVHKQANIFVKNTDAAVVAAVFSNPTETSQMWFDDTYAAGFTKFLAMINDDSIIRVVMGKE